MNLYASACLLVMLPASVLSATASDITVPYFPSSTHPLGLASRAENAAKGNRDALDWLPEQNRCWFAQRVVAVKTKYRMTVDRDEADTLEAILVACKDNSLTAAVCDGWEPTAQGLLGACHLALG